MYSSMLNFPASVFGEFDRLRRELDDFLGSAVQPTSIRSVATGSFPPINVGHTPGSVEVYAFAPGLDAAKIDVTIDRGVLSISGERPASDGEEQKRTVYSRERVTGPFRRAVALPDDVDPGRVQANYRDGVLRISIARQESALPKRIAIQ